MRHRGEGRADLLVQKMLRQPPERELRVTRESFSSSFLMRRV